MKTHQCLLAELLVPDDPGSLGLESLGLVVPADFVVAEDDCQASNLLRGHAEMGQFTVQGHAGYRNLLKNLCPKNLLGHIRNVRKFRERSRHLHSDSLCDAVRGGEDVPVVDERAAAELLAVVAQLRDPRPLVLLRRPAVHDAQRVLTLDPLRYWSNI